MASQVTRQALSELLGVELPENCEIIVRDLDATETSGGDAEISEAELEAIAGGAGGGRRNFWRRNSNRGLSSVGRFSGGESGGEASFSRDVLCFSD